jgi:hypothetical protein
MILIISLLGSIGMMVKDKKKIFSIPSKTNRSTFPA